MAHRSHATAKASPFTNAVVSAMRTLYPEEWADKSFDNTGLLLEAPFDPARRRKNSVLLTIDLTKAVADEAIARKDCVIVAYHPIIFRGLKSLTLADTQQQSLLRLALEGISVYSPHTAIDAAQGGLGDWLADIVTESHPGSESAPHTADEISQKGNAGHDAVSKASRTSTSSTAGVATSTRQYSSPSYPSTAERNHDTEILKEDHVRKTIHPIKDGPEGTGIGRLITFSEPQPLTLLIERIGRGVGTPKAFPVATPQGRPVEDIKILTVAICAGSGGSVLKAVDADLWLTGELSHHEALAATEQGKCVISLFHSNSERGYLRDVMKPKLNAALQAEWAKVRDQESKSEDLVEGWKNAIDDETVEVEVSNTDRDPYGIVVLRESP